MDGREGGSPAAEDARRHEHRQETGRGRTGDPAEPVNDAAGDAGETGDPGADPAGGGAADQPGEPEPIDVERFLAEYEKLRQDHEALTRMYEEMKNARLRLQAEFDNFRRRTREEDARRKQEALEGVLRDLLPIVDNMERAAGASKAAEGGSTPGSGSGAEGEDAGIREGVALILQQLRGLLEARGVTPAPGVGEPFDPRWHHAVAMVEAGDGAAQGAGEAPAGAGGEAASTGGGEGASDEGGPQEGTPDADDGTPVVIEEFQKGYVLGGRAIRPSLVTVGPRSALPGGSEIRKGNER